MFKFRRAIAELLLCSAASSSSVQRKFVTAPILRKCQPKKQFTNASRGISRTRSLFMFIQDTEIEEWAEKMIHHKLKDSGMDGTNTCFSDLLHWWYSNVYESTLNVHGLRLLVKIALDNEQGQQFTRKSSAIAELWDYVKDTMRASDFLAFLVLEMIEREQLEEAKIFTKLLSIEGVSFTRPLRLLVWRASMSDNLTTNLRHNMENRHENHCTQALQLSQAQRIIEQLSTIVQECYFDVQHTKKTRKKRTRRTEAAMETDEEERGDEEEEQAKDSALIASSRYQSLFWLWMPNRVSRCMAERAGNSAWNGRKVRKQRNSSRQVYRMDAKDMAQLGHQLVKSWAEITTKKGDAKSWDRLMDFVEHNNLPLDEKLSQRWHLRLISTSIF